MKRFSTCSLEMPVMQKTARRTLRAKINDLRFRVNSAKKFVRFLVMSLLETEELGLNRARQAGKIKKKG